MYLIIKILYENIKKIAVFSMAFIPDILVYNIFHIELEKIGMWNIVIWLMYAIIICVTIIPINVLLNNHFKFLIGKTSKR